jgi:hypothetical protein
MPSAGLCRMAEQRLERRPQAMRRFGIIRALRGRRAAYRPGGIGRALSPAYLLETGFFLHSQIGMNVDLRRFDGFVAEPESNYRLIDAVLQ